MATHTIDRAAVIQERWRMATTELRRFESEPGLSVVNAKEWEAILDGLVALGARLVDEVDVDQFGELEDLVWNRLSETIQSTLTEWAVDSDARRYAPAAVA